MAADCSTHKSGTSLAPRSPLGSILNLSNPTSEEQTPSDNIYNASLASDNSKESSEAKTTGSSQEEWDIELEPPRILVAEAVQIGSPKLVAIDHPTRSQCASLDVSVHYPTQLDAIAEVSTKASSRVDLQSMAAESNRGFNSSSSNERLGCLPIVKQYPQQPIDVPPERAPSPPNVPRFNTPEAARYHIPAPSRSIKDRLSRRPSPERLNWLRQTSNLPAGAISRAPDGSYVKGMWTAPRSDHTGSSRHGFRPDQDPFNRQDMMEVQIRSVSIGPQGQVQNRGNRNLSQKFNKASLKDC